METSDPFSASDKDQEGLRDRQKRSRAVLNQDSNAVSALPIDGSFIRRQQCVGKDLEVAQRVPLAPAVSACVFGIQPLLRGKTRWDLRYLSVDSSTSDGLGPPELLCNSVIAQRRKGGQSCHRQ
jgi:hypothetical protein